MGKIQTELTHVEANTITGNAEMTNKKKFGDDGVQPKNANFACTYGHTNTKTVM